MALEKAPSAQRKQSEQTQVTVARRDFAAILFVGAVAFLGILTETSMGVAFPRLIREFGIPLDVVQWLASGYLLVIAVIMVASSFLNARCTARALFRTGASSFILGCILCLFAHNFPSS
jgi:DHA2 family lincomycin resistance protein-like MFS transporter